MIRIFIACALLGGCVVDVPVFVERDAADTSDVPTVDTNSADTSGSVDTDTGGSVDTNQTP